MKYISTTKFWHVSSSTLMVKNSSNRMPVLDIPESIRKIKNKETKMTPY